MKLYVYENLLSERFVVREINQSTELISELRSEQSSGQSPKKQKIKELSSKNKTYEEIFKELNLEGNFLVIENDEVKQYPQCSKDVPMANAIVHVKRIPKKDAGTASWWLGGVMALAGAALTIFTCGLGATIGVSLMVGGASVLAGKAIADIYKSPNVPDQHDAPQGKEQYGLQGGKNRAALGGKYPVIFGRHIITPPLCGAYYTELSDNTGRGDMYLYGLLCIGYGQLSVKDIKFGQNPLATNSKDVRDGFIEIEGNFKGQIEIKQNGTYPSLYQYKHREEQINAEIKETDVNKMETRFTPKKTIRIKGIVTLQGLYKMKDNGDKDYFGVTVVMAYRKKGAGSWTIEAQRWIQEATADTLRIELTKYFSAEEMATNPDGEWEAGIYRTTVPSELTRVRDKAYWSALTCMVNERPVIESEVKKLCLLAFKIKASETANGVLDQLNCIASSVLPIYNGVDWNTYAVSSNPASAYLHCLRGNFLPEKAATETIDWHALERLYVWCEENEYKCDGIISNGEPLRSILNKILATCRASFYIRSGLYSLIHDIEKPSPIALLTPKNSRGFGASKSFAKLPKGLEITYNDRRNNYVPNNDIAVLHGESVDGGAGEIVEKLSMWGVTGYEQVIKLGRYLLASARNRPEKYSVTVSIEHFGLPVGERVLLQHDVLLVGLAGGFIKAVDVKNKTIQIDEVLHVKVSTKYAIEVFKQDGSIAFLPVKSIKTFKVQSSEFSSELSSEGGLASEDREEAAEQVERETTGETSSEIQSSKEKNEETIADTFEIEGDLSDVSVGDIYAFGVSDKVVEDCLIEAKIINQSPSLSAELSLIPYAPEVFEAPNKPVPAYNPKTTIRSDYALAVVKERQRGETLNNGGTVQDDGGIYFDFGGYSVAGNRLINRGMLKTMGDGVFSGVTFEASDEASDVGKNYAVANPVSQIKVNVDTLLYKDSSINFWIRGKASKGQSSKEGVASKDTTANGFVFSRAGINGLEKYQLYWDNGRLIITIQNMKERVEVSGEAMITIVNDFSNAEVRVYVNAVLKGRYATIETNAVSEDGYNLVDEDGESSIISEGLISYQEANRDIPFYLFGNGEETSSFSGKVRLFRIFGWSLSGQDVTELYENNKILVNTAAETRYLGEFSLPPEDVNLYDVFKYAGETNSMFIKDKKYAAVPSGEQSSEKQSFGKLSFGWQVWEE